MASQAPLRPIVVIPTRPWVQPGRKAGAPKEINGRRRRRSANAVGPRACWRNAGCSDKSCVMDQRWRVVSSKDLLHDRWINVRADHCVTSSGTVISPYYVLTYPDWVHVVAVTRDDCLVLVRQYRHAAGAFFLELPGGMVDASDCNAELSGRRELAEETGYVAARWQPVSVLHPNPAIQTNRVHVFLALDAECRGLQSLDAGEDGLTVHLVPISEVLDGLSSGLLGQSMHVSAVLMALAVAGRLQLRV